MFKMENLNHCVLPTVSEHKNDSITVNVDQCMLISMLGTPNLM